MNQKIKTVMLVIAFIFISIGLFAQLTMTRKEKPKFPKWVSDKGYWVIETNLNAPKNHTIWFYTNDNVLMYKETLQGVRLDAEKRKVKMKLKKALESSAIAWQNSKNGLVTGANMDQSIVKSALQ